MSLSYIIIIFPLADLISEGQEMLPFYVGSFRSSNKDFPQVMLKIATYLQVGVGVLFTDLRLISDFLFTAKCRILT